jgi:ubiquinone/menaquinone biosynthesis C-methylase UbiE
MSDQEYWKDFWNKNTIIEKEGIHEKVGRTIKGIAIENERWDRTLKYLEEQLALDHNDDVLDIAAGSGAIAIPFSKKTRSYTALDISEKLLTNLKEDPKINIMHADVMQVDLGENRYSKVILYFALQHFSMDESVLLFKKIFECMKPNGICLIGDIPDEECKFSFFDTPERKQAYFDSEKKKQPIIGTWFNKKKLQELGTTTGFSSSTVMEQPSYHINTHYRFDQKLIK